MRKLIFNIIFVLLISSCTIPFASNRYNYRVASEFNVDSAYRILKDFVAIGPRVPNTRRHDSARNFIVSYLRSLGYEPNLQRFVVRRFDSVPLHLTNIIVISNPRASRHVLLFTHWDSRFIADKDSDYLTHPQPVLGANDGGSGTAVLLEIARILRHKPLKNYSIDFAFFDGEDQGPVGQTTTKSLKYWALGSRYWAKHKPQSYSPMFGIGVDMVGYKHAKFEIEGCSAFYNGYVVKRLWKIAAALGYDTLFINHPSLERFNSHIVLSQKANIRSVMVMENIPGRIYGPYWHTSRDSLNIISKKTLKAVGQTLITAIYNL